MMTEYQKLWQAKRQSRLPHALLFLGEKGTHKARCAEYFARALLCTAVTESGDPCNVCPRCRQVMHNTHPNVLWVQPEEKSTVIKIDQIRAINDFVYQTALQDGMRIVIIHPADALNIMAANALLKTLEEPPKDTLLILISDQRGRHLPATVVSRCQRIVFPSLTKDERLAFLLQQPGRQDLFQTLMQLAEAKSCPVQSAEVLQHHDPLRLLDYFLSWMMDVLRLQLNSEALHVINEDYTDHLIQAKTKTQLKHNVNLMEYIQQLRMQLCDGINLNKQMMLEAIFVRWMECAS